MFRAPKPPFDYFIYDFVHPAIHDLILLILIFHFLIATDWLFVDVWSNVFRVLAALSMCDQTEDSEMQTVGRLRLIRLCSMHCVWIRATAWQIWSSSPFWLCVQTRQWKWFGRRSQTNGAGRISRTPFLDEICPTQRENLNKHFSVFCFFFKSGFIFFFFRFFIYFFPLSAYSVCSVNALGRPRFYAYQVNYVLSPICHLLSTHLKSEVGWTLQVFRRTPAGALTGGVNVDLTWGASIGRKEWNNSSQLLIYKILEVHPDFSKRFWIMHTRLETITPTFEIWTKQEYVLCMTCWQFIPMEFSSQHNLV